MQLNTADKQVGVDMEGKGVVKSMRSKEDLIL